jgi:hypothetical protein
MNFCRLLYAFSFSVVLASLAIPAKAQLTCGNSNALNVSVRAEGTGEQVGDIIFTCFGGTPTAPGTVVPSVNITVSANTNITSSILATLSTVNFNEALLIVDSPNTSSWNPGGRPLTNCGYNGEDSGPTVRACATSLLLPIRP